MKCKSTVRYVEGVVKTKVEQKLIPINLIHYVSNSEKIIQATTKTFENKHAAISILWQPRKKINFIRFSWRLKNTPWCSYQNNVLTKTKKKSRGAATFLWQYIIRSLTLNSTWWEDAAVELFWYGFGQIYSNLISDIF